MSIDKPLSMWRKVDDSLSSSIFQRLKDAFSVYNKHMKISTLKSLYLVLCLSLNFLKKWLRSYIFLLWYLVFFLLNLQNVHLFY